MKLVPILRSYTLERFNLLCIVGIGWYKRFKADCAVFFVYSHVRVIWIRYRNAHFVTPCIKKV